MKLLKLQFHVLYYYYYYLRFPSFPYSYLIHAIYCTYTVYLSYANIFLSIFFWLQAEVSLPAPKFYSVHSDSACP